MNQTPLTDTQAVILSAACARPDAMVFPVTARLKGGAVGNVCKSLLKRGLIEEIPAIDLNTVWRHDEELGPITLRATLLANSTLGIIDAPDAQHNHQQEPEATPQSVRRSGTKQEAVIAMLRAEGGATVDEIMATTNWAGHTTRGFLSGALKKKLGLTITSEKVDGRGRTYKIADG
jgi:hypothetical protein